jgi:sigma-B regulation protein RsbU (phosphoserine phosphatase)
LFLCVGKVAGKGIPAAMLMAQAMTLLSHLGSMQIEPEKILLLANNTLAINNKTDMSIATFCGFLNVKTGRLRFSNAKYIPMLYIGERAIKKMRLEKTPALGTSSIEEGIFKQKTLYLKPKDILFFTTNGIDKALNPKGELLDKEYLLNSFKNKTSKNNNIKFALERLKKFYGPQMSQVDVTLLSLKYKGGNV